MATEPRDELVEALFERHGRQSLAEQADITVGDKPNTLFQLLQLGMLASVRVGPTTAAEAFLAFRNRDWSTPQHLAESDHDERVRVLQGLGYEDADAARVSTMMGDAAAHLLDRYGAKLGDLRAAAAHDPSEIRAELERFVEVDDDVVDAFFRDVQQLWREIHPFADKKALDAARRLQLGDDAVELRRRVGDDADFVRLVDALVRARHDGDLDAVRERAAS